MDNIWDTIDSVKTQLEDVLTSDNIRHLSCQELDKAIEVKQKLFSKSWQENDQERKEIKQRYLGLLENDELRVTAIFHWQDSNIYDKLSYDSIKNIIITIVNNNSTNTEFNMLWELICQNKIKLNREDVQKLSLSFIQHISSKATYANPSRSMVRYIPKEKMNKEEEWSDDEYDLNETKNKTSMTRKEEFWVNVLANTKDEEDINQYLLCLSLDADQRLRYFPVHKRVFTGELTGQIIEYYKTLKLSPVIKYRRNLDIILNNLIFNLHAFEDVFPGKVYCSNIAVEFPYMCYVYPTKIEVELYRPKSEDTNSKIWVDIGQEHILSKTLPYEKSYQTSESNYSTCTCTVNIKQNNLSKPVSYISIGQTLSSLANFECYKTIRVYGEAIIFI